MGPGSQPGTENLTYTVKAKAKAKKAPAKKAKAEGQESQEQGPRPLRHPDVLGQEKAQLRDEGEVTDRSAEQPFRHRTEIQRPELNAPVVVFFVIPAARRWRKE